MKKLILFAVFCIAAQMGFSQLNIYNNHPTQKIRVMVWTSTVAPPLCPTPPDVSTYGVYCIDPLTDISVAITGSEHLWKVGFFDATPGCAPVPGTNSTITVSGYPAACSITIPGGSISYILPGGGFGGAKIDIY